MATIRIHCIEKSSLDSLLNISFCVSYKRESRSGLSIMGMNILTNYPFKMNPVDMSFLMLK